MKDAPNLNTLNPPLNYFFPREKLKNKNEISSNEKFKEIEVKNVCTSKFLIPVDLSQRASLHMHFLRQHL